MPNYGLVINSKFRPFSYQEMLAPVMQATQVHQGIEETLSELETKANIWDGLANESTDPITYKQYKKYANDLKNQADILATEGLTDTSRQTMLNLKSRYSKEILPIEQAYQRRAEQIAEQRKAGSQTINSYDAATTSLDKFLANPSLSYSSLNRGDLLKEATALMGQFANELRDFRIDGNLDKFHKRLIESYGLSKEDATTFANAIAKGDIDNTNAVQALAQHIYNSTGVDKWNNREASDRVWQTIAEGVSAGIGKSSAKALEDVAATAALQHHYAVELENLRHQHAMDQAAQKNGNNSGLGIGLSSKELWSTSGYDSRSRKIFDKMSTINSTKGNPMLVYAYYNNKEAKDKFFQSVPWFTRWKASNTTEMFEDPEFKQIAREDMIRENQKRIQKEVDEMNKKGFVYIGDGKRVTPDEYKKNPRKYNSIFIGYMDPYNDNILRMHQRHMIDYMKAKSDDLWKQHVLDTFGVSDIIDSEDYELLQTMGLSDKSDFTKDFETAVNNTAARYTMYGTNLPDYESEEKRLRSNINNAIKNDQFAGTIYELKPNGTKGSAVRKNDLALLDPKKKVSINDIYYTSLQKGRLVVSTTDGHNYIIDPSLLDAGLTEMIRYYEDIYKDEDRLQELIATAVTRKLNAINPRRAKTSEKA